MNQLYRYLCLGLLGLLLVAMVVVLAGVLFFPGNGEGETQVFAGFSVILDGSFYESLETYITEHFPARDTLTEKFRNFQDWYTLVDQPGIQADE